MNEKRLFLLDAMALIYRAYYALIKNPMRNSKGLNTSAIYGFTSTLLDVLKRENPTHIAVVFDTAAPTERHEAFDGYKANREATPEDILTAIPVIIDIIKALNIPAISLDGYEADDIIGTLTKNAEQAGYISYMMTPDKDFGQLVSEKTFIYKPAKGNEGVVVMGVQQVCQKFEIERPEQVVDILGLMGDAVDNIPGVPGIGEKTAKKLIAEYGSVENLLENRATLSGKIKENLDAHAESAMLSKRLAKIICDVPITFDEKKLERSEPDWEGLRKLFNELEFRKLAERVFTELKGEPAPTKTAQPSTQTSLFETSISPHEMRTVSMNTITIVEHNYLVIDTYEKRKNLIATLAGCKTFCFDTETTDLDTLKAEIVGLSLSVKAGEAFYIPVPEERATAASILGEFREVMENETIGKTGQNLKFDIAVLNNYDIHVKGILFDTMLAHYILQPDMRHNMNFLSETYLNYSPVPIEALIGKRGKAQGSMRNVALEKIVEYCCEDADVTLQLKNLFEPMLASSGSQKLFEEIETPLIPVLVSMEREGVKVDTAMLSELSRCLEKDIIAVRDEIHIMAGFAFNIDSPKQLGEVLYDRMKIVEKPKKTKTGQYSTSEDVLAKLSGRHPVISKILDFRSLRKLKSTYVDALPQMINLATGRIHTSFNQAVAATGRLSSDNPNLQNIPIRTERGREIRKGFVPRNADYVLLSADYSQIELRIIAHLSGDEEMIKAFEEGADIHTATAAKVFGVKIEDITREMRSKAKAVNFGIAYGQGAYGLSQGLDIPRSEASAIIDNFFKQFPRIRSFMDNNIAFARKNGYAETILGRKRFLADINSANAIVRGHAERNAINAPIQGSAADMIKIAMVTIHKELQRQRLKSKMILQVHDELVFDVLKEELDAVAKIVEGGMKEAIPLKVPVVIGMKTGTNWLDAH